MTTPIDAVCDWQYCKDWRGMFEGRRMADGSIVFRKTTGGPGSEAGAQIWTNRATFENALNGRGQAKLTWTVPPQIWCPNQDIRISSSVEANGKITAGSRYRSYPVGDITFARWDTVEGTDPAGYNAMIAGDFDAYVPSRSGVAMARPRTGIKDRFDFYIQLSGGFKDIEIHYVYEPAPGN